MCACTTNDYERLWAHSKGTSYLPGPQLSIAGVARVVVHPHDLLERLGAPMQEDHRQALATSRYNCLQHQGQNRLSAVPPAGANKGACGAPMPSRLLAGQAGNVLTAQPRAPLCHPCATLAQSKTTRFFCSAAPHLPAANNNMNRVRACYTVILPATESQGVKSELAASALPQGVGPSRSKFILWPHAVQFPDAVIAQAGQQRITTSETFQQSPNGGTPKGDGT